MTTLLICITYICSRNKQVLCKVDLYSFFFLNVKKKRYFTDLWLLQQKVHTKSCYRLKSKLPVTFHLSNLKWWNTILFTDSFVLNILLHIRHGAWYVSANLQKRLHLRKKKVAFVSIICLKDLVSLAISVFVYT